MKNSFKIAIICALVVVIGVCAIITIDSRKPNSDKFFTVTWANYDGTILSTKKVASGSTPSFDGDAPKKPSDSQYSYTFSGWLPATGKIYQDTTYVAQYDKILKTLGVEASHQSGFFEEDFNLTLTTSVGAKIYYTLDSSTPDENSTLYTQPLRISDNSTNPNVYSIKNGISSIDVFTPTELVDKCTVLKAVAIDELGNKSQVICKTFFVDYNNKKGYDNLPIVSLVLDPDDLFDYETGIYVTGKTYDQNSHVGYPETYPANYNQKGREWERKAEFTYFLSDKSFSFEQSIGVRIHGGWSRAFNQKSFNLYTREEYSGTKTFEKPFFETKKLKTCMLRSGGYRDTFATKTRDYLAHTLSAGESFSTQDALPCIVFLNGEYWGVYCLQERFTEDYIEEHYGVEGDNVVIVKNGELDEGLDVDIALYEELIAFFENNNFSSEQAYEQAKLMIDVDEFAAYMATELYIGNADWPGNNVRIWRARQTSDKPYEDGRWRFMMYDTDDSMGMLAKAKYDTDPFLDKNHWKSGPLNESCLLGLMLTKLLENAQFKNMFRQTFIRIGSENFSTQKVNELLVETSAVLKEPMTVFYKRFVSEDANTYNQTYFLNKVDVIREFFKKRYSYALGYLNDHIPA